MFYPFLNLEIKKRKNIYFNYKYVFIFYINKHIYK